MSNHPITPPPELVHVWAQMFEFHSDAEVFSKVAQWGADQELEACAKYVAACGKYLLSDSLICARRPKPPTLKEQALELVRRIEGTGSPWALSELSVVRRALEALPND